MTQDSELAAAARRLLNAEHDYNMIKSYIDNLPVGAEYDLGLRIDWQWGSSTNGYKEVNRAVHHAMNKRLRDLILATLEDARLELFAAQSALKAAA